jgi:hypothetical protein
MNMLRRWMKLSLLSAAFLSLLLLLDSPFSTWYSVDADTTLSAQAFSTEPTEIKIVLLVDQSRTLDTSGRNDRFKAVEDFIRYLAAFQYYGLQGTNIKIRLGLIYFGLNKNQSAEVIRIGNDDWLDMTNFTDESRLMDLNGRIHLLRQINCQYCETGAADFEAAFDVASNLMIDAPVNRNERRAMIWLTDGSPDCSINSNRNIQCTGPYEHTYIDAVVEELGELKHEINNYRFQRAEDTRMYMLAFYAHHWSEDDTPKRAQIRERWEEITQMAEGNGFAGLVHDPTNLNSYQTTRKADTHLLPTLIGIFNDILGRSTLVCKGDASPDVCLLQQYLIPSGLNRESGTTFQIQPMQKKFSIVTGYGLGQEQRNGLRVTPPQTSPCATALLPVNGLQPWLCESPAPGEWKAEKSTFEESFNLLGNDAIYLRSIKLPDAFVAAPSSNGDYFQYQKIALRAKLPLPERFSRVLPAGSTVRIETYFRDVANDNQLQLVENIGLIDPDGEGVYESSFVPAKPGDYELKLHIRYATFGEWSSSVNTKVKIQPVQISLNCQPLASISTVPEGEQNVEYLPGEEVTYIITVSSLMAFPADIVFDIDWKGQLKYAERTDPVSVQREANPPNADNIRYPGKIPVVSDFERYHLTFTPVVRNTETPVEFVGNSKSCIFTKKIGAQSSG